MGIKKEILKASNWFHHHPEDLPTRVFLVRKTKENGEISYCTLLQLKDGDQLRFANIHGDWKEKYFAKAEKDYEKRVYGEKHLTIFSKELNHGAITIPEPL